MKQWRYKVVLARSSVGTNHFEAVLARSSVCGTKQCWHEVVLARSSVCGTKQCWWYRAVSARSSVGTKQCWRHKVVSARSSVGTKSWQKEVSDDHLHTHVHTHQHARVPNTHLLLQLLIDRHEAQQTRKHGTGLALATYSRSNSSYLSPMLIFVQTVNPHRTPLMAA